MIQSPLQFLNYIQLKTPHPHLLLKKKKNGKLHFWTLTFILYFNLVCNVSNVSI